MIFVAGAVGIEPTIFRLTADCFTIEPRALINAVLRDNRKPFCDYSTKYPFCVPLPLTFTSMTEA